MRILPIITAAALTFTLSGCSAIENFFPEEEADSNVNIFDENAEPTEITVEDSPSPSIESPDTTEITAPEESLSPDPQTEENSAPTLPLPVINTNIGETIDFIDRVVLIAKNSCTIADALGSLNDLTVDVIPQTPNTRTIKYTIMHAPDSEAIAGIRTIAYYPASATGINPEILEDHKPFSCELAALYPTLFDTYIPEDTALDAPAPKGLSFSRSGETYRVTFGDKSHTLITVQNQIIEATLLDEEAGTLTNNKIVKSPLSKSDLTNFENLYFFIEAND